MIKQIVLAALAVATMASSAAVSAQSIAIVDIQSAILSSAPAQQQLEDFAANPEISELVANARSLQADLDSLNSQATAEASRWTNEDYASYNRSKQFLEADLSLAAQKINSEQERIAGEIINATYPAAVEALQQIIEEQGVSLLFDSSTVLHADPTHNLTTLLSERLSQ